MQPGDINSDTITHMSHATIEQAVDGIIWHDAEGRIHRVNQAACRLLGYSQDALLGMTIAEIDPKFPVDRFKKEVWESSSQSVKFETRHVRKDGETYPAEVTIYLVRTGETVYACLMFRDITERKKMEMALVENEKLLSAVLDHHFQLTGLLSADGILLNINQTALNLIAATESEVVGKLFWKLPWWFHSRHEQDKLKSALQLAREGSFVRFETTHKDFKGEIHSIDFSLTPLKDDHDRIRYLIPEARDITKLKKTQEDLKQALKEVQALKVRLQKENIYLREEIKLDHNFGEIIGDSPKVKEMLDQVQQVAYTDTNVLILGETGTGKELIARAIHDLSSRRQGPLVKVNCAALPGNLIESELFGHEKGAFTGALSARVGRFELADGSTLFLDEIGDLPLELQVKLLRVLQEGEFERLGSTKTRRVNVRVISATNRNLYSLIQAGGFREDLFYRLNVFPINCPPLRNRKEDIPLLVRYFVEKYSIKTGTKIEAIPGSVVKAFQNYHWPGNVRELENIVERALVTAKGSVLEVGDWFHPKKEGTTAVSHTPTMQEIEKQHICKTLEQTRWRVSGVGGAAEMLGLKPTTLEARMKKLGIKRK